LAEAGALWKLGFCADDPALKRRNRIKHSATLFLPVRLFFFTAIWASKNLVRAARMSIVPTPDIPRKVVAVNRQILANTSELNRGNTDYFRGEIPLSPLQLAPPEAKSGPFNVSSVGRAT
jgi:hypothetical protein